MDAGSDNSNRNGGAAIGMGGDERIASNLINRLLLVYVPVFLFGIRSLDNVRGVSVCSFTLSLDLANRGVTVCSFHWFGTCGTWCYCVYLYLEGPFRMWCQ